MSNDNGKEVKPATTDMLVGKKPVRSTAIVEIDGEEFTILFESIGRDRFNGLIEEHTPEPTEDEPNPTENTETLAPVLISVCAIEPKITLAQAKEICSNWNDTEISILYKAAVRANISTKVRILGNV